MIQDKIKKIARGWSGVIITVPITSALVIGLRWLSLLQHLEWAALDTFFQLRPLEPRDERILIVAIEEPDIQRWREKNLANLSPLSDQVLATLLNKIKQQKPRVIGLDLYRDIPENPGHEELVKVFESTPNLIGVQKVIGNKNSKVAPPPELDQLDQVSAVDVVVDDDNVLRRGMLYLTTDENKTVQGLGLALAEIYLQEEGITSTSDNRGFTKFNETVLKSFEPNDGGYVRADAGGDQILINYRGPANSFSKVSLTDVLENRIPPDLMRDRIVLVGVEAESLNDFFSTPYSKGSGTSPIRTSGVEIHANIASQVVSSVLNNRPLIKVWSEQGEESLIVFLSGIIAIVAWRWSNIGDTMNFSKKFLYRLILAVLLATVVLISSSYLVFILSGLWISVVPPLLALCSSATVITGYIYVIKLQKYTKELQEANNVLEFKVEERTQELKGRNQQLEQAIQVVTATQKQLINQEKLASLGRVTLGLFHNIRNSTNIIANLSHSNVYFANNLQEKIEKQSKYLDIEVLEQIITDFQEIADNSLEITQYVEKIEELIQDTLECGHQENFKRGERELADINKLVDSSANLVLYSLQSKYSDFDIRLEKDFDCLAGKVKIFAEDVNQVIICIVDNACQAAYSKSKIITDNFIPTILIKTKKLVDSVEISIKDNGQGIPEEILNEIFEPFFTTKAQGEGIGLGLFLSHNIIYNQHQGEINVETQEGVYTKFIITLPNNQV